MISGIKSGMIADFRTLFGNNRTWNLVRLAKFDWKANLILYFNVIMLKRNVNFARVRQIVP